MTQDPFHHLAALIAAIPGGENRTADWPAILMADRRVARRLAAAGLDPDELETGRQLWQAVNQAILERQAALEDLSASRHDYSAARQNADRQYQRYQETGSSLFPGLPERVDLGLFGPTPDDPRRLVQAGRARLQAAREHPRLLQRLKCSIDLADLEQALNALEVCLRELDTARNAAVAATRCQDEASMALDHWLSGVNAARRMA
jgi:hypothetical protein